MQNQGKPIFERNTGQAPQKFIRGNILPVAAYVSKWEDKF